MNQILQRRAVMFKFLRQIKNPNPVISFKYLRRLIGILGMLLPWACLFGGWLFARVPLQPSISHYYYTNARDVFVGLLVATAMFLLTYRGDNVLEWLTMSLSGAAALGIALFPCRSLEVPGPVAVGFFQLSPATSNLIHFVCALLFFLLFVFISLCIFMITDEQEPVWHKITYPIFAGIVGVALLVLGGLACLMGPDAINQTSIVFWCETVMLTAFGFSWLVKSGLFEACRPH